LDGIFNMLRRHGQFLLSLLVFSAGCTNLKIVDFPQHLNPLNQNFLTAHVNYHRNAVGDQELSPPLVQRWRRNYVFFPGEGLCGAEKNIYLGTGNGYLAAARVSDGKLLGKKSLGEACALPPTLYEGILYQSLEGGNTGLVAYDPREGKILWHVPGILSKSSPLVKDRKVFLLNQDGVVQCHNFLTGDLIWSKAIDTQAHNSPALDENYLITAGLNGKVSALEYTSGVLIWENSINDAILADPVIHEGCVYVATYHGTLYLLDMKTGITLDSLNFDNPVYYAPVIDGSMIFMPCSNGQLIAVNRHSLDIDWKFQSEGPWGSSPLVTANYIYAANLDEKFYILDKKSGELLQQIQLGGRPRSTPIIIDKKLIFCCENTTIVAYGQEDK